MALFQFISIHFSCSCLYCYQSEGIKLKSVELHQCKTRARSESGGVRAVCAAWPLPRAKSWGAWSALSGRSLPLLLLSTEAQLARTDSVLWWPSCELVTWLIPRHGIGMPKWPMRHIVDKQERGSIDEKELAVIINAVVLEKWDQFSCHTGANLEQIHWNPWHPPGFTLVKIQNLVFICLPASA